MIAFNVVLCPIDFSELAERTVRLAAATARRMSARLVLHHNLEASPPGFLSVRWMWSEEHETKRRALEAETPERLQRAFAAIPKGVECEARLTHGPLDTAVLEVAERVGADLIVMGSHGWSDAKHRSLTERMVLAAPCPVLTASESCAFEGRPEGRPEDLEVLVPVDFTPDCRLVLDFAREIMEQMPHRLRLVHVVAPTPALDDPRVRAATLREREERLASWAPSEVAARTVLEVREGLPADAILAAAAAGPALFLLMPAARPSLLRRVLFGDTTLRVLHDSPCPVWFVPPAALSRRRPGNAADSG